MRSFLGIGLILALVVLGAVGAAEAQEGLTKRDRQGPVTVAITLAGPPAIGAPIKAKMVLDTHSVSLDAIAFEQAVAIRTPDGTDVAPTAVEQATGSGHHREAVLVFPALTSAGSLRIVVKDVGGVAERTFVWE
jgi:hypothetical protein